MPQSEQTDLAGVIVRLRERFPGAVIQAESYEGRAIAMSAETALIALTHLADNALRHNAHHIQIEARAGADAVVLTVTNDGDAISLHNRERIFDAFFTTRRDSGGTGMGLAIVRAIMTSHGGGIMLLPRDKGVSFALRFPLSRVSLEACSTAISLPSRLGRSGPGAVCATHRDGDH